ncbi:MAG TPA: hypothetical protein VM286_10515 [Candidatus Thermoplasmatota archaeon]|nr:hypothetical protein [Candidatus Thermoplasmatota archaeon]
MKSALAATLMVLLAASLAGCSGSTPGDDDKDGLTRDEETFGWDVRLVALDGTTTTRHVTSDPAKWSTDGSALDDHYKYALGLDPNAIDTDHDGLTDCQEVRARNLTQCADADSPGPFDGGYGTRADQADTDQDGLSDAAEVLGVDLRLANGTVRSVHSDPLRADTDRDGLLDGKEIATGGDPQVADTDGDGCKDGLDVDPAHDLRLLPGLQSFKWNGSGSAQVQFILNVGGAGWTVPPDHGVAVGPGENKSLADEAPTPLRPTCSFSPAQPWMPIQVFVYRIDGTLKLVDVGAKDPAAYVNGLDGRLSMASDGTRVVGSIVLRGPDATLRLTPQRVAPAS